MGWRRRRKDAKKRNHSDGSDNLQPENDKNNAEGNDNNVPSVDGLALEKDKSFAKHNTREAIENNEKQITGDTIVIPLNNNVGSNNITENYATENDDNAPVVDEKLENKKKNKKKNKKRKKKINDNNLQSGNDKNSVEDNDDNVPSVDGLSLKKDKSFAKLETMETIENNEKQITGDTIVSPVNNDVGSDDITGNYAAENYDNGPVVGETLKKKKNKNKKRKKNNDENFSGNGEKEAYSTPSTEDSQRKHNKESTCMPGVACILENNVAQTLDPENVGSIKNTQNVDSESAQILNTYTQKTKSKKLAHDASPRARDTQNITDETKQKRTRQSEHDGPPNLYGESSLCHLMQTEIIDHPNTKGTKRRSPEQKDENNTLPDIKPCQEHDFDSSMQVDHGHDAKPTGKKKRKKYEKKGKINAFPDIKHEKKHMTEQSEKLSVLVSSLSEVTTSVENHDSHNEILCNEGHKQSDHSNKDAHIHSTPCLDGDSSLGIIINELNTANIMSISLEKPLPSARRKLVILDLNGLLADVLFVTSYTDRVHKRVGGKAVFKRPFCDEFLEFCFGVFDVGVWSSRRGYNVNAVVDYLMGNRKHDLLFRWDQSHCTKTGFSTIENEHKPLVLKELKKLWDKDEHGLWENGKYSPSNTLLIDDSPYKALCNPPYTAIFPYPYSYLNEDDNSLGPGGDLRVYLEKLAMTDNVQHFVKNNPFGQPAITESNTSWSFYTKIIEKFKT